MDYAHLNLEHFFARNDDLDVIRDRSDFVMINNFTNEMKYRDGEIEGTIDRSGEIYDNASPELRQIRIKIRSLESDQTKVLKRVQKRYSEYS